MTMIVFPIMDWWETHHRTCETQHGGPVEFEVQPLEEIAHAKTDSKSAKSSTRMLFDAQVSVIKNQIGDLETIRQGLGLSQRKICQLLMVDPSSWTRWTRWGENIPPHIYRALQWYMIIQEKIPGLTPQYFIGKDPEVLHQKAMISVQNLERKLADLEKQNALLKRIFALSCFFFAAGLLLITFR
jgi:hypothetical protein